MVPSDTKILIQNIYFSLYTPYLFILSIINKKYKICINIKKYVTHHLKILMCYFFNI